MTIYSDNAAHGVNPESFLNVQEVFTQPAFEKMMLELASEKVIILDSETVGNTALPLFLDQLDIEKKIAEIYDPQPEYIQAGELEIDESKRILKEYEAYLKEAYNTKTVTLKSIAPDQRELLQERRKRAKTAESTYVAVLDYRKLCKQHGRIQDKIDSDKSGLMFHRNRLGLVQIGTMNAVQYLIEPALLQGNEQFKTYLRTRSAIIGTNLKFDMLQLGKHLDIWFHDTDVVMYDIILAAKMVRSGSMRRFGLKDMALEFLGYDQSKEERISYWLRRPLLPEQTKYGALDVIVPGLVFVLLKNEIREKGLQEVTQLQMDFLKVLTKMEATGIYVDIAKTHELVEEVNRKTDEKREAIAAALGDEIWFNPEKGHNEIKTNKDLNSPKETLAQLQRYGMHNGILPLQWLISTSKESFEDIEEDIQICKDITEFRSLLHTKENFCSAFLDFHIDGRIHSSYTQIAKEGTRMSSKEPNVQNISQPGVWNPQKHATWEEAYQSWSPKEKLRTLFVPTPGRKLYDADYGAIELCMIAFYSQDHMMLKALNEGIDLHALTANSIFHLGYTYDQLKDKEILKDFKIKYKKERNIAKEFNFAVGYGAGVAKLRKQLRIKANIYDMSEEEIRTLRTEWFNLYPGVKTWQENILHTVKHYGYVTTRMGRQIYFEDPATAYSKAFNTPIQASCYEGLQRAAIIFDRKVADLEQRGVIPSGAIRLVNLVHDEFVVEANENINENSINRLIESAMLEGMEPLMSAMEVGGMVYDAVPVSVDAARILRWSDK